MHAGKVAQVFKVDMLAAARRAKELVLGGKCSDEFNWHNHPCNGAQRAYAGALIKSRASLR
ncbi:hypothetical protein GCM10017612_28060 [Novosphingobium resinovorum]|nr:hypothetical protein GCM10017612_28060 [Novosphingobium resinovorum]